MIISQYTPAKWITSGYGMQLSVQPNVTVSLAWFYITETTDGVQIIDLTEALQ